MKFVSPDKASSVSFQVLEVETERYPSANLFIEVADDGFCGSDVVWVGAQEWDSFVEQLQQCELNRRGSATLTSMSPGEFKLQVENCDSLGHFVARYELTQRRYLHVGSVTRSLNGGFDLDSEFIGQTFREFVPFARVAAHCHTP